MEDFVKLVKHKREQVGMSTRELSKAVGMSSSYISELERGKVKRPPYTVAKAIADVIGIQESVLDYYGFVPDEVERQSAERLEMSAEQYAELDKVYRERLAVAVETMSVEQMGVLLNWLDKYSDIMFTMNQIEELSHNSRNAITAIREFVDFIYQKYVPSDYR